MPLRPCALLLLAACAVAADPSLAPHRTYAGWHSGVIGGGGFLQHVVFAPSDARRVYLTSDVGGCWRSDDGGERWRMLHGALPADGANYEISDLIVDPRDADAVLLATDRGVWRSTDAGATWTQTLRAHFLGNGWYRGDGRLLRGDPGQPDTVYAAPLADSFQVSSDGGRTWRATGAAGLYPNDLVVDRSDPKRLWLSARVSTGVWVDGKQVDLGGGFYLSEDAAKSWVKVAPDGIRELVQDPRDPATLVALTGDADRVRRSTDRGRTWTKLDAGLAPATDDARHDGAYGALAVSGDEVVIGGNGGSFYRLAHGAAAWTKVARTDAPDEAGWWGALSQPIEPHFGSALSFVGVDPRDAKHWAFTDWYALYQSRDAGLHWRLTIDGVEMTVVHVVTQDAGDPRALHVGVADVGCFHSRDGGSTFAHDVSGISDNVKHIAVCAGAPKRLYAVGPQRWEWHANQVFVSDDGGASWRRSPMTGIPDQEHRRCNTVCANPANGDEAWLTLDGAVGANDGGAWRSTDAGATWTWAGEGLPAGEHLFRTDIWVAGPEIAASADGSLVCASDDRGRVFRRAPGASAWSEVRFPADSGGVNAVCADQRTPGRFWLCRKEGGLWKSDDGGASWARACDRDAWSVAVDLADAKRVALNGAQGVLLSRDGGATWTAAPDGLPYRHPRDVVAFAGDRLAVGTGGNGVFWIALSDVVGKAEARGAARSTRDAPANPSLVANGGMDAGGATPDGWSIGDRKGLARDTTVFHGCPAALRLDLGADGDLFAQQALSRPVAGALAVHAWLRARGGAQATLPLQVFDGGWKQIAWLEAGSAPSDDAWHEIASTVTIPDGAEHVLVGVRAHGSGTAWLDDYAATVPAAEPKPGDDALPQAIAGDDARIALGGRWDRRDATAPRCSWSGTAITVKLRGAALGVQLDQRPSVHWQVEVDGAAVGELPKPGPDGLALAAKGLAPGDHVVRLVKRTEAFFGAATLRGIRLPADATLLASPKPTRRLHLIGDSITCGYGDEAADQNAHFSDATENGAIAYGALAAKRFGAEYECAAWSGKCLWPKNSLLDVYDRVIADDAASPAWDAARSPADAIVINLGTNDFAGGDPDEDGWVKAYGAFIAKLRVAHPKAMIYCALGPMLSDQWSASKKAQSTCRGYLQRIVRERAAAGDQRVKLLEFPMQDGSTGFGADWHPSRGTHERMARQLGDALAADLGWSDAK